MLDKFFPLYALIFLFSLFFTAVSERKLIPYLRKKAMQPIYTDGPSWHSTKSGTPTMGGLAFVISVSLSVILAMPLLWHNLDISTLFSILISIGFAVSNSIIGVIDDLKKLKRKQNEGLTPKQKLALQILFSCLFLLFRYFLVDSSTSMSFSFGELNFGYFYYPICLFILLGMINSVNLTDGIDGLASSVTFAVGISLFYISSSLNTEVALVSSALIGSTIGFLIFNLHPAKIFMGDTGSLFLGALTVSCAFSLNNPLIIIFVGGVYAIEGLSVVLQVISFKTTKRRIFKMSPLHHHLEQCGWSENRICIVAILTTFILSIPAYIFYLP